MSLSVLYVGDDSPASTSRQRAEALRRLGCNLSIVNPNDLVVRTFPASLPSFVHYKTGYRLLQGQLLHGLKSYVRNLPYDPELIWVNGGELLGSKVISWLKGFFHIPIVLYQNDDPTGKRDSGRFSSLRSAIPLYDLCVFVRPETEIEALAMGAQCSIRVMMSYDEKIHSLSLALASTCEPVVSFIGSLIPGERRDLFLNRLYQNGLPISLVGGRWTRSPFWKTLRHIYKGPALTGSSYSQALASAAVTLGFLSHGNRDLITTRSLETTASGGLLCAERTSEHQLLYEDGQEAVFWNSVDDCVQKCRNLLANPVLNLSIRSAGHRRVHELGGGNEDVCRRILNVILHPHRSSFLS
jgi:hypothetical protein